MYNAYRSNYGQYLQESSVLRYEMSAWLAARQNRDNKPRRLTRRWIKENIKPVLLLIDAENVPDLRRVFYIDPDGLFRFITPVLPQVLSAPSYYEVSPDSTRMDSVVSPVDGEIFIAAYAHERSQQASFANRITTSFRRDAADGK